MGCFFVTEFNLMILL